MLPTEITSFFEHLQAELEQTNLMEASLAVIIPLLALLIGTRTRRYLDMHSKNRVGFAILDYITPLIAPVTAILFTMLAITLLPSNEAKSPLLTYMLKLFIGWSAIALVMVMSTKRTPGWILALVIIPVTLLQLFDVWEVTVGALQSVEFHVGTVTLNLYMVFRGIAIILLLQWLTGFTVHLVDSRLNRVRDLRASNRALIMKIFQIALYCFVFMFAMQLLGISLTALGVFGGALGVGIGFGLQKIASNFISGIILLFEKSIETGDLVELADGSTGWVRQTYARYTRLEMTNGKEMFIPNEEFISQRVISWTHSNKKAQVEIPVSVGYDTDIPFAQKLMNEIADAHPASLPGTKATTVLNAFGNSGIDLKLQFWVKDVTAGRTGPRSDIMLSILEAFRKHEISLPYPQQEVRILNEVPQALTEREVPPEKTNAKATSKKKTLPLKAMP